MTWETKVEMVNALNNREYEEAVAIMNKESDWDAQCIMMFVNGFDITKIRLLGDIKERLLAVQPNTMDFRTDLRLAMIQTELEKEVKV